MLVLVPKTDKPLDLIAHRLRQRILVEINQVLRQVEIGHGHDTPPHTK
jgi:hypothetical protein